MTYLEQWLKSEILRSWRRTRQPVRTVDLAARAGTNDRTLRQVLARMEQRGQIRRRGQRGGWLPVDVDLPKQA